MGKGINDEKDLAEYKRLKDKYESEIMELQLVTLETTELAKQKGFDVKCRDFYDTDRNLETTESFIGDTLLKQREFIEDLTLYEAPTQELLKKWLRERHNIVVTVSYYLNRNFGSTIFENDGDGNVISTQGMPLISYDSYEEALESGLKEGLKKIINK